MPISRYAMFAETNPRRFIAVLVVLNKYHLTVHITDVSTKVPTAKFKSKHQKQNGCNYLFVHVFVCKPGASFFLSLARLTAVWPGRPPRQNMRRHLMSVYLVSAGQGFLFFHQHPHLWAMSIFHGTGFQHQ